MHNIKYQRFYRVIFFVDALWPSRNVPSADYWSSVFDITTRRIEFRSLEYPSLFNDFSLHTPKLINMKLRLIILPQLIGFDLELTSYILQNQMLYVEGILVFVVGAFACCFRWFMYTCCLRLLASYFLAFYFLFLRSWSVQGGLVSAREKGN